MAKRGRLIAGLACVTALVAGCTVSHPDPGEPSSTAPPAAQDRPNIVFVLTDDLSNDLVPYMSEVQQLAAEGTSFSDYFVANSLCCPSRATIQTGMYPHNTQVLTNAWPLGGFDQFFLNDLDDSAGPLMKAAGYRTGFMGKFLNQYQPGGSSTSGQKRPSYPTGYIPPGWDTWDAVGSGGYQEFDYTRAVGNNQAVADVKTSTGDQEADYLTDVLSQDAGDFITQATAGAGSGTADPFFLMVSTFGTHSTGKDRDAERRPITFPPAPRDRPSPTEPRDWPAQWDLPQYADGDCGDPAGGGCDDVTFPPTAEADTFGKVPTNPPSWLVPSKYSAADVATLREWYLERIQMAQSINDLIAQLRVQLDHAGVLNNTYIVFSSDNGFHLGEHDLWFGKRTAFDHDINVPLIIRPPGGSDAVTVDAIAQNTDLLPTFLDIAGTPQASTTQDGRSLRSMIGGGAAPADWRNGAFIEQRSDSGDSKDPDSEAEEGSTHPPSYRAIRTDAYLYVDYAKPGTDPSAPREGEFYDLRSDPNELTNIYGDLSATDKVALAQAIDAFYGCAGATCRTVDQSMPTVTVPASSSP